VSTNSSSTLIAELASFALYKKSQGRLTRRVTAGAVSAVFILGARALHISFLMQSPPVVKWGVPLVIAFIGVWAAFRAVNYSAFAEFLIATESEVEKVQWPDRRHVIRASIVVMVAMVVMAVLLFVFDIVWRYAFSFIGFLEFVD
jgi:preprotein translocase subunit SecE